MEYNSNLKKLMLPEYGRNIQKMVDYAVAIEDRQERRKCVDSIINVMGNFFPHLRDVSDFKHKLWDHIAIMSDFKLDIDFPYKLPEPSHFLHKPKTIPYAQTDMKYKHYGILIEKIISEAVKMEDGDAKNLLISSISNQMRRSLYSWNKDIASDDRIIHDIKLMSKGLLIVNEQQVKTNEILNIQPKGAQQNRNKKKHSKRRA